MWYNQERARMLSKRVYLCILPLIFPNLGHLERYNPLNNMCFWSFQWRIRHFISQKEHCMRVPHAINS